MKLKRKLVCSFTPGSDFLIDIHMLRGDDFTDNLLSSIAGQITADSPVGAPDPLDFDLIRGTWTCSSAGWPTVLQMLRQEGVNVTGWPAELEDTAHAQK